MDVNSDHILLDATLAKLRQLVPSPLNAPKVAIVCGSGLGTLASAITDRVDVPYAELPGFMLSLVEGHQSILAFGYIESIPVVAMLGRFHAYEGYSLRSITFPIRLFSNMGCKNLILTNAAGSLNKNIRPGTVVVVHDHLALPNLTGLNVLIGPRFSSSTPRFLPLSNAYSRALRKLVFYASHKLGLPRNLVAEGTYVWVTGPTYETAAEGDFLRKYGDVVGASTVPEVVVAREEDMQVLVLSLVTNMVVMPEQARGISIRDEIEYEKDAKVFTQSSEQELVVSHEEVLAMGLEKAELVKALVVEVVRQLQ